MPWYSICFFPYLFLWISPHTQLYMYFIARCRLGGPFCNLFVMWYIPCFVYFATVDFVYRGKEIGQEESYLEWKQNNSEQDPISIIIYNTCFYFSYRQWVFIAHLWHDPFGIILLCTLHYNNTPWNLSKKNNSSSSTSPLCNSPRKLERKSCGHSCRENGINKNAILRHLHFH